MNPPYPLIEQSALERRLGNTAERQAQLSLSGSEWGQLLSDIITEEGAFVAEQLSEENVALANYGDATALAEEWPQARRAMVRLCRASLNNIDSDGLNSESVGDHSEDYRPPAEIRMEVADELTGINGSADGETDTDGFRSAII